MKQSRIEEEIIGQANEIHAELIEIRRDLHKNPELSGQESRTSGVISERLKSLGLEVHPNIDGYGVVGILRMSRTGPVVAYRADMDALPQDIQEQVSFGSATPGVSHACGHDVHSTIGLGIAQVLSSLKNELPGTVVFIFQPAEETITGAKQMIAEGVLENPAPEAIFALHVVPNEVGNIVSTPAVGLPGVVSFTIKIEGTDNPASAAEALADSIRSVATVQYPDRPEKWISGFDAILTPDNSFSRFILIDVWAEDGSRNEEMIVRGNIKASGGEQYDMTQARISQIVDYFTSRGFLCDVGYENILPDMVGDRELAEWAVDPLRSILGDQAVHRAYSRMPFFGEDFAFYLQEIPGVMFFLGASNSDEGITALPHSPTFAVDERAILTGVKGLSNVIARYQLDHVSDR